MDYSTFKNSTMIWDKSAGQQVEFTMTRHNPIDVFDFFNKQQITVCAPLEAKQELGTQVYNVNLFSGIRDDNALTTLNNEILDNRYVFSRTNGTVTTSNLDPYGFEITLISKAIYSTTFDEQYSALDKTPIMQRLLNNKRSLVDAENIRLARYFKSKNKNFFVFTNDQEQIKQLKQENIKYLRPDKLFAWMCIDGYIDPRKGAWNFKKRRDHNNRWVGPNKFKDILLICTS